MYTISFGGGDNAARELRELFNDNVNDMGLFLVACDAWQIEIGEKDEFEPRYIILEGPFHVSGDGKAYLQVYMETHYDEYAANSNDVEDCTIPSFTFPATAKKHGPRRILEKEVIEWLQQLKMAKAKKESVPKFQWFA